MKDVSKTWSFAGIPLLVNKDSEDYITPRMAELGPLDANYNYVHFGGTEALKRDLSVVLFTGYKQYNGGDGLYDLVGSGYHALVSDQESEGNYIITEAKTDRVQDIHRPPPASTYKIQLKLTKSSLAVPVTNRVYVATKTNGLYYTSSLTFNDATDPTWTLEQGDYGIEQLSVDMSDPTAVQAILSTGGTAYIRRPSVSDSWVSILTPAEALTEAQAIHPLFNSSELQAVAYNGWIDGRVYVLFRAWQGINRGGVYMATSTDYGSSWNVEELNYYDLANRTDSTGGSIAISPVASGTYALGYTVWASFEFNNADWHQISVDAGDSWTGASIGSGSFVGKVTPSVYTQGTLWTGGVGGYEIGKCVSYSPGTYADTTTDSNTGPFVYAISSELFEAPDVANSLALAYQTLKYSTDGGVNWNTGVRPATSDIKKIAGLSWSEILVATNIDAVLGDDYHVLWSTPDRSTFYDKAGVDPQNNAAGTSIPYNCGGVAKIICWEA